MSHSPQTADADADQYVYGWLAISQLLSEGKSLSGRERNCLFLNLGNGREFVDVSGLSGFDYPDDGRAMGLVDWDRDGRLDLWVSNRTGPRVRFLRNNCESTHHAITFQLEGRAINRDAIGSRVTVTLTDGTQRTRSLRAGEGFLGQSDKVLHFGVGSAETVAEVAVAWAGGATERWGPLPTNAAYHVVQGEAPRRIADLRPRSHEFASRPTEGPTVREQARIVLAGPVPVPLETYTYDSKKQRLGQATYLGQRLDRPLLVNLWSTSCIPCLRELHEFAEDKSLRDVVNIVALNVDGAEEEVAAHEQLEKIGWPFDAGIATKTTLERLDIVQRIVSGRRVPMPVPTSFLFSPDGKLATIYRGPVAAVQLRDDAASIANGSSRFTERGLPFTGWWHRQPAAAEDCLMELAFELMNAGYLDDATYALKQLTGSGSFVAGTPAAQSVAVAYLNLGARWAEKEQTERAITSFQRALDLQPEWDKAHYALGQLQLDRQRPDDATRHFQAAVAANPKLATAHYELAKLALTRRDATGALEHGRRAVEIDPDRVEPLNLLARVLASYPGRTARDVDRAIRFAQRAVQLSGRHDASSLETLAAAYAAANRMTEAIKAATDALELAKASKRQSLQKRIESRLGQYRRAVE